MSRTIRRKGKAPDWVTSESECALVKIDGVHYFHHWDRVLEGKELAKAVAVWHSDQMWMQYPPDAQFRKLFGHKYDRQRERRALNREFYALEKGNEFFYKPRNIDWLWW